MSLPVLILASASPRRQELLRRLGLDYQAVPSAVEELQSAHLSLGELARVNAWRKAHAVARTHPNALVIGMDTLVGLGRRVFGKPASVEEAARMIQTLQGQTHSVMTGVCLIHRARRRLKVFTETTEVTFRRLTVPEILRYLKLVNPLDKAGAYGIQEHGELLVERIDGSFSNVVGLPLERLQKELKAFSG